MTTYTLAEYLVTTGILKTSKIVEAFKAVDRKKFVPKEFQILAYEDHALPIGYEQTISQPYTVAFTLELLDPKPGQKILDIGAGSGWTTALLAHIVGKKGRIIGLERIQELVEIGQTNLKKFDFPWASIRKAESTTIGLPAQAPYERILVSAEAETIPDELIDQLGVPGRLVIPTQQSIVLLEKDDAGKLHTQSYPGFVFVPLIQ